MDINFSFTQLFEKDYKRLLKKYSSLPQDLAGLQKTFSENPETVGTDLGAGFRKIRLAIRSKGRGKSGGARVITHEVIVEENGLDVLLVTMYDKSEVETIDVADLKKVVAEFRGS